MPAWALGEPSRKEGAWVWSFSTDDPIYGGMMPPGQYMAMVLTARDSGDETIWDMTISLSNDEIQIDNYRMIDGRMSKDGSRFLEISSHAWSLFRNRTLYGSEMEPYK